MARQHELTRKCLTLIGSLAARGAHSQDREHIGFALQELTQALFERTGHQERLFEPVCADEIQDLPWLHAELHWVASAFEVPTREEELS